MDTLKSGKSGFRHLLRMWVLPTWCVITLSANAATLYKWIDSEGNVTYQDIPPPSDVEYEEKSYAEPEATTEISQQIERAARENPISLYAITPCDACDLVRLYLEKRSIPFAEKDIRNNAALQNELEQKTGRLIVPTLIIGSEIIDGYNKTALGNMLSDQGFPVERIQERLPNKES